MPADRTPFHAERLTCIGGSDMASLFSLEPWGCQRRLMYQKLEIPQDYQSDDKWVFERGHIMEPVILRKFAEKTGRKVTPGTFFRHIDHKWAAVHIDGTCEGGVLEIKCLGSRSFRKYKKDGLADGYILQLHYAAWATSSKRAFFAIFNYDTGELLDYEIDVSGAVHESLVADIVDMGDKFWAMRARKELPERLPADSMQCRDCEWRRSCQGEAVFATVAESAFDPAIAPLVTEYTQAKEMMREAEALVEAAREPLEEVLGDRTAVETTGYRLTYAWQDGRETLNRKALEGLLIELKQPAARVKEVLKIGKQFRTLRIYPV